MLNILNRFRGKRAKKRLEYSLAAVGLTAVTVLTVAVTSAYMTALTEEETNVFEPYTVTNTTAVEKHGDNYEPSGGTYEVSKDGDTGVTTDKNFSVANPKGDRMKAVYVRVYPVITGESKTTGEDSAYEELTSVEIDDSDLGSGWEKGKDGYYYYQYVLEPGYRTPDLFQDGKIKFKNLNTEDNDTINLTFIADTVQAWSNGSRTVNKESVTKAWGENPGAVDPGDSGVTLYEEASPDAVKLQANDVLD